MSPVEPKTELKHIPIDKIKENPVALRAVNRTSQEYLELVESIRIRGVLNPINVREVEGGTNGETYGLCDGLHRLTAARDAGLATIPAQVINLTDAQVMEAQIMANVHKVETKPAQYAKQLIRILSENPLLLMSELASKLGKSSKWLQDRLSLNKLDPNIQTLVDENKINLTNAYALAKLEKDEQANFLERAMTEPPNIFVNAVNNRAKEVRDAKRKGRAPGPEEYAPQPHLHRVSEIKAEIESPSALPAMLKKHNVTTAEAAAIFTLKWVLNLDPDSIAAAKEKHDAQMRAKEEEKARKKQERDAEKQKTAKETQERMATAGS